VTSLLERIHHHIAGARLLKRGARVVVAVSGGVDSMVLLHALHTLAPAFGWKLSVAHFNHRLRGRSSDADQRFVRATARRLKLPCDVGAAEVRRAAKESGESIEMAARGLRHRFLAQCARKRRATFVALAHHADDQVELFLLRLLRGSGGAGLAGMKPGGVSPADRRVVLVRPLLESSKAELIAFARAARLRFREDASNATTEFSRNWVRQKLLPLLRQRQPAINQTILRAMQTAGADSDFVGRAAENWRKSGLGRDGASHTEFSALHVAVQRRVVQSQLRELGLEPDFQQVEELRTAVGRPVTVAPQLDLACDTAGVVRRVGPAPAGFEPGREVIDLTQPSGDATFAGVDFQWRVRAWSGNRPPAPRPGREYFDVDKVGARLVLRHWQAGDRFQPIGLPKPAKLQDWFTNRKVPVSQRRGLVLAEAEQGSLFWVEGERIGESCKLTPKTRRILEWHWRRAS
jgi:tRNA(Ile)-lysidine synthase